MRHCQWLLHRLRSHEQARYEYNQFQLGFIQQRRPSNTLPRWPLARFQLGPRFPRRSTFEQETGRFHKVFHALPWHFVAHARTVTQSEVKVPHKSYSEPESVLTHQPRLSLSTNLKGPGFSRRGLFPDFRPRGPFSQFFGTNVWSKTAYCMTIRS